MAKVRSKVTLERTPLNAGGEAEYRVTKSNKVEIDIGHAITRIIKVGDSINEAWAVLLERVADLTIIPGK
jgi:hypothetical protein